MNSSHAIVDSRHLLGRPTFLIVGNFAPDIGYAWNTIGEYFLCLGHMFAGKGFRSVVSFPEIKNVPDKLRDQDIELLQFDFSKSSLCEIFNFIRDNKVKLIYLTDRPAYSTKFLVCRLAGAKFIVIHDRTSGDGDEPLFFKRIFKALIHRTPFSADIVLAISEYVKNRLVRVSCFPAARIVRIWNGTDLRKFHPGPDDYVYRKFEIPMEKKVVVAYSRANRYKGIEVLIEAADILIHGEGRRDLFFLYLGDGPDLEFFRSFVRQKNLEKFFLCPGKSDALDRILKGAVAVVVPSLWQEGFGLSVIEGMATEKVVIASRVGGIVEILEDGKDGYLVSPGDSRAIADRLMSILDDESLRIRIGKAARRTVELRFDIDRVKQELQGVFGRLEGEC